MTVPLGTLTVRLPAGDRDVAGSGGRGTELED